MSDKIVTIAGQPVELLLERQGARLSANGQTVEIVAMRDGEAEIVLDGRLVVVPYAIQGSQVSFSWEGEIYTADVAEKGARTRAKHRDHSMAAPMPGLILKILVAAGDVVAKGAPLIVLEAMKMEHQIVAPYDGTVASVNCREGELVQPGLDLVELNKRDD